MSSLIVDELPLMTFTHCKASLAISVSHKNLISSVITFTMVDSQLPKLLTIPEIRLR